MAGTVRCLSMWYYIITRNEFLLVTSTRTATPGTKQKLPYGLLGTMGERRLHDEDTLFVETATFL